MTFLKLVDLLLRLLRADCCFPILRQRVELRAGPAKEDTFKELCYAKLRYLCKAWCECPRGMLHHTSIALMYKIFSSKSAASTKNAVVLTLSIPSC